MVVGQRLKTTFLVGYIFVVDHTEILLSGSPFADKIVNSAATKKGRILELEARRLCCVICCALCAFYTEYLLTCIPSSRPSGVEPYSQGCTL